MKVLFIGIFLLKINALYIVSHLYKVSHFSTDLKYVFIQLQLTAYLHEDLILSVFINGLHLF